MTTDYPANGALPLTSGCTTEAIWPATYQRTQYCSSRSRSFRTSHSHHIAYFDSMLVKWTFVRSSNATIKPFKQAAKGPDPVRSAVDTSGFHVGQTSPDP
ncbi:hypothetical protein DL546_009850 [Coniochaeta pulveracea]|uniref:Uncharacterized protein n=1 Tax=Coniochaeta pulveracea TaxID=177199 RepID=A0A420YN89_9PEZI|nr:hypothetical protein DL546_009850 [Coniochaeta pulveracea]